MSYALFKKIYDTITGFANGNELIHKPMSEVLNCIADNSSNTILIRINNVLSPQWRLFLLHPERTEKLESIYIFKRTSK